MYALFLFWALGVSRIVREKLHELLKVVVELKALVNLEDVHLAQAKNYVVAYDFEVGLLINFGSTSLQYKKVFQPVKQPLNPQ
jgi:GxxExxY protein